MLASFVYMFSFYQSTPLEPHVRIKLLALLYATISLLLQLILSSATLPHPKNGRHGMSNYDL